MNTFINLIVKSAIAFIVVISATILSGPAHQITGNFIWLQLGAVSMCYLICGYRIFFAVFLAIIFAAHGLDERNFSVGNTMIHFIGAFSPLLAIASMRFFKLSKFFEGNKVIFQHLLFLALLTAIYNTILKFYIYSYFNISGINGEVLEPFGFIKMYLIGDILGCLIVLFFTALVVVPAIRYFIPSVVPSEFKSD